MNTQESGGSFGSETLGTLLVLPYKPFPFGTYCVAGDRERGQPNVILTR